MKNIKFTLAIFFGGIFALWLLATSFPDQWGVFPVRNLLLQLTGTISILAMSGCLILAVRPKMLETPLGGLEKCTACTNGSASLPFQAASCIGPANNSPNGLSNLV